MKFLVGLLLLATSQMIYAQYQFSIGEEILTQENFWRRKLNQTSSCFVQFLAKLTVTEIHGTEVRVKYESDAQDSAACENGSILSFEPHYLDTLRDQYKDYKEKKLALNKIKNGLSVRSIGDYFIGDQFSLQGWRWVVVEEAIGNFREGDLCRVIDPGHIEIIGFYENKNKVLFTYQDSQHSFRECPEGTIYFDDAIQN